MPSQSVTCWVKQLSDFGSRAYVNIAPSRIAEETAAMIDTGAPLSILPRQLFLGHAVSFLSKEEKHGPIMGLEYYYLLARVEIVFVDCLTRAMVCRNLVAQLVTRAHDITSGEPREFGPIIGMEAITPGVVFTVEPTRTAAAGDMIAHLEFMDLEVVP